MISSISMGMNVIIVATVAAFLQQRPTHWHDPFPHRSAFIGSTGMRLHYLDWGGHGPPVVLLPGFSLTAHAYDDLASALSKDFRVVAVTPLGFGESDAPENRTYTVESMAADLGMVLDSLRIPRASLVGHSISGSQTSARSRLGLRTPGGPPLSASTSRIIVRILPTSPRFPYRRSSYARCRPWPANTCGSLRTARSTERLNDTLLRRCVPSPDGSVPVLLARLHAGTCERYLARITFSLPAQPRPRGKFAAFSSRSIDVSGHPCASAAGTALEAGSGAMACKQHREIGSAYVYVHGADALHAALGGKGANVQGDQSTVGTSRVPRVGPRGQSDHIRPAV